MRYYKRLLTTGALSLFLFLSLQNLAFAKEENSGILWYLLQIFNKAEPVEEVIEEKVKIEVPKYVKSIYLTADTMSTARGKELIDALIENGGNAVVIDIEHGGGQLAFNPKNEYLKSINPGRSTLKYHRRHRQK